ncbi:protein MRP-126-like [Melanotaenia boesemani]|uniref:protein MRP-126-like n=1 Tax=Melanotaenia boesemani TaxID=1250792 RepID=UPI001C041310|nr:protein MRP-126-like [Melanotaenia boesemani]
MSQLETAMGLMMKVFDTYAGREGKKDTLSKAELKALLEKELPALIKAAKNPQEVDKLMKDLDFNGDSEVDFSEYVVMVAAITSAAHDRCAKKSNHQTATMSQLETAMALMIKVFDTYAGREGKKDTLTKTELKALVEKELPALIKAAKNPEQVDKLLKGLDLDGDSEVDFTEYVVLVASLTLAAHDHFGKK